MDGRSQWENLKEEIWVQGNRNREECTGSGKCGITVSRGKMKLRKWRREALVQNLAKGCRDRVALKWGWSGRWGNRGGGISDRAAASDLVVGRKLEGNEMRGRW